MTDSETLRRVHKRAAVMRELHAVLSDHIDAIGALFVSSPKLTLIVRHPDIPGDTSIVITNDDIDAAIAELQLRKQGIA